MAKGLEHRAFGGRCGSCTVGGSGRRLSLDEKAPLVPGPNASPERGRPKQGPAVSGPGDSPAGPLI